MISGRLVSRFAKQTLTMLLPASRSGSHHEISLTDESGMTEVKRLPTEAGSRALGDLPLKPGREIGPDGHSVGCDPRKMTREELQALGHEPMSPLAALRERCIDCCAGSPHEVRLCVSVDCASWPFRMGVNTWREKRKLSEEHRAALTAGRQQNAEKRLYQKASSERSGPPVPQVPLAKSKVLVLKSP